MVRIENMDEATARIEAALYSAGRPLRIEDIIRASGTESRTKTLDLLGTTRWRYQNHTHGRRNNNWIKMEKVSTTKF